MPQVGPLEIAVVLAIALIVFGPQRLPGITRSVGRAFGELRRMATEMRSEFESGLDDVDEDPEEPEPAVAKAANPDDVEN